MNTVLFDPTSKKHRSSVGGAEVLRPQTFYVYVKLSESVTGLHFCVRPECHNEYNILAEKVDTVGEYDVYKASFTFISSGLYWYCFSYWNGERTVYIGKGLSGHAELMNEPNCWQMTVYKSGETPAWYKGKVMYQIFPDRFNRAGEIKVREGCIYHENWYDAPLYKPVNGKVLNNDFFGGNFEGIIERLDYLKSLNVSIIYLNPIFEAESNHKYDTCDFEKIDEAFGGEEKFRMLLSECEKRGIKVILDGVFNHVGENSKYFNKGNKYIEIGAYNSKSSKYYDWFTFLHYPDKYLCWWDILLLPAVNEEVKSYEDYITGENGIIAKYMKMGVWGFRIDVADELPDAFLKKVREAIKRVNPDGVIIGEVWEDASNKISYDKRRRYFTDNILDGVMNYPWKNAIIDFIRSGDSRWLYSEINELINNYPKKNLDMSMNILSTHDTARLITALAGESPVGKTKDELSDLTIPENRIQNAIFKVKAAASINFTLPGTPCIYYGDEIGMQGYSDPFNRRGFDFLHQNAELLNFYETLANIRKNAVFEEGKTELLPYMDGVIAFKRGDKIQTVVNLSDKDFVLDNSYLDLISSQPISSVSPNSFAILALK